MNVQQQLALIGAGMRDLGNEVLDGNVSPARAAMRLGILAEMTADLAAHLRPERPRLTGWRRWWFLATRRRIA